MDDLALETARRLAGVIVRENQDASKVRCPSCGAVLDLVDADGLVYENDSECAECGLLLSVTNVVVRVTVTWRERTHE